MVVFELVRDEDILHAVKNRGPIIPLEIRSILGKGDSITIGAALSSTVARGQVKITNVKKGGSPFYYVPGQEVNLEKLGVYLNEKDRRTFAYLKEKKIIRDSEEEPLTRVSLRNIPDFAKKIPRIVEGQEEFFWRWFLVPEDEALFLIEKKLNPELYKEKEVKKEVVEEKVFVPEQRVAQKVVRQRREKVIPFVQEVQVSLPAVNEYDFFAENSDEFLSNIKDFFDKNKIIVKESKLIRKGSDFEFVILMDTPVGKAEYFCKAKGKKRCNEGDLSQAYLQGQFRRLPVLFLTNGEITIKAKDKLSTDFKGLLIKELL